MGTARNAGRAVVASTALLGVLGAVVPSDAGTTGRASVTSSVGSGSWSVVATSASTAPYGSGPLTLNFGALGAQTIFFNAVNTGTLSLTGATYSVSATNMPNGSNVSLFACLGGVWNLITVTCVGGTATSLVTSTGALTSASLSTTGTFPQTAGAAVQILAFL